MLRTPSGIPRSRSLSNDSHSQHYQTPIGDGSSKEARKRQAKKDETIRKKLAQEFVKQTGQKIDKPISRNAGGTVGNLRPLPAITLLETATASEAARHMAVKRADAVLVTDEYDQLTGIVTDKDLVFRVLAESRDPRSTCLGEIMTRDPSTVTTTHNATDALNKMVGGGFRHLPVTDNASEDIIGMLDITECLLDALSKLERAHKSTKQLSDALDTMSDFDTAHNKDVAVYIKALREQLGFPKLSSILNTSKPLSEVSVRTNVRDAARLMKERHQTATLVLDEGKTVGIFTSKDIVVRVMAMGLDPTITSTVRVMTPSPDMCSPDTTILDALRKMHGGHYQHLPLFDENHGVVGVVDILELTYTTLNTLKSIQPQEGDGPVWNKFWNAMAMEEGASDSQSELPTVNGSICDPSVKNPSTDDDLINFKFTDPNSMQTHRFNASCKGLDELLEILQVKMGLRSIAELTVSYIDDENDKIVLTCDEDLYTAILSARKSQSNLIRLVTDTTKFSVDEEVIHIPLVQEPGLIDDTTSSINHHPTFELLMISGSSFGIGFAVGSILMWALLRSK
ncbi:hypothetical protein G9A89_021631 [Geosiphon pyriformis]|nr:hypothetical protein G9A89_021631 [Geosiphon pyriformis]